MMIDRRSKKSLATRARHQVNIQSRVQVPDNEGGFVDGWTNTTSSPVWAEIAPIQARQRLDYKTIGVDATHLIRIDGLLEITEQHRIVFGDRNFEVLTVENLQEADNEKVVTCLERR
jgi:SPP1 family predicted phage head-tail adaptor